MSLHVVTYRPKFISGGLIALSGFLLAWLLPGWLPEGMNTLLVGALTGGFGVAAAGRIWPTLPLRKMIQYGPAVAVYGALIGLIVGN